LAWDINESEGVNQQGSNGHCYVVHKMVQTLNCHANMKKKYN